MIVANSFDLWQKDAFFSAAEEVQESADVMESAYRMWIREKKDRSRSENLDEMSKELQTALGTAKWQLEEFERAVRLSHGHRCDDITASRHRQFVAVIEGQISRIEAALREALNEGGKEPLRWVNLDKEECDDLAMFLSGVPQQVAKDDCITLEQSQKSSVKDSFHKRKDADLDVSCCGDTSDKKLFDDAGTSNQNIKFILDVEEKGIPGERDDIICQADKTSGTRKTWSLPNFGALRIVIADEDGKKRNLMLNEATPKEKGLKSLFWKQRFGEHLRMKRSINLFRQAGGFQGQLQMPSHPQFSCSIQFTLALMLSIFLIVPFLLYSA